MNVCCIRHPKYDGTSTPVLACKACCQKFLATLKSRGAITPLDTVKWLEDKTRMAQEAIEQYKSKQDAKTDTNIL